MNEHNTELFLDGFKFTEGLRWHQNQLWFCDLWDRKVYCYDLNGLKAHEISLDDKPVGLGWLSDGSLLITSLMKRKLLRYHHNQLSLYQSLELAAPGYCHDFTVSKDDVVYLSASGFYPAHNVTPVKSNILMVTPNKNIKIAATNLGYPNGIIITPDGKNLIVSESFSATLSCFEINKDHELVNKKTWAKFDDLGFQVSFDENGIPTNKNRHYPDGICFDPVLNGVWVASPGKKEVLCIDSSGKILQTIHTVSMPFDCALGGQDNRTLFVASSDMDPDKRTGKIEKIRV